MKNKLWKNKFLIALITIGMILQSFAVPVLAAEHPPAIENPLVTEEPSDMGSPADAENPSNTGSPADAENPADTGNP